MVNRLTGLTHLNGLVLVSAAGLLVILGIVLLALRTPATAVLVVGYAHDPKTAGVYLSHGPAQPPARVANTTSSDAQPSLSPDHQQLVLVSDRSIVAIRVDGSGRRALTHGSSVRPDASPAWSPDGHRIAFLRRVSTAGWEIYTMAADGSDQRRLTSAGTADPLDIHPAWGPDSLHLVFANSGDLYLASLVSSCVSRMPRPKAATSPSDSQPAWSGDGSSIAFVSHADGDSALFIINGDGTGRRRVSTRGSNDLHPSWSADSRSIIFERIAGTPPAAMARIFQMDTDGGNPHPLTDQGHYHAPSSVAIPDAAPVAYLGLAPAPANGAVTTLGTAVSCDAPQDVTALATGDFNRDGHLDVVVLGRNKHAFYLMPGRGDGTLGRAEEHALPGEPLAVTAADFNGDSNLDLAVVTITPPALIILLGDGRGGFRQAASYDIAGGPPLGVDWGTLRPGGPTDLVVTQGNPPGNSPALMSVLLGRGDGTFGSAATYPVANTYGSANHAEIVDFDGDGNPDVVVSASGCGYANGGVDLFLGNGRGGLRRAVLNSSGAGFGVGNMCNSWATVADFNHDGHLDIATVNGCFPLDNSCKSPSVKVWYGRGRGIVADDPAIYPQPGEVSWITAADLRRNGQLESITGGSTGVWVQFPQAGGPGRASNFQVAGGATAVAVGDFNGDGWPDVVAVGSGSVSVLLNATGVPSVERSLFSRSLLDPRDISTDPRLLFSNGLAAFLVALLIVFPSNLFNSTLAANYKEVRGWFAPLARPLEGLARPRPTPKIPQRVEIAAFLLAGAIVVGLVDPGFGFNIHSVPIFVGMLGALAFGAAITSRLDAVYAGWRFKLKHRFRVYPGALAVAVVCVGISRAVNFLPGYVYGLLMGAQIERDLDHREHGPSIAFAFAATFLFSIAAWLLWVPVKSLADKTSALPFTTLDVMLAAVFVAGLQGILFGLIPVRFQPGAILRSWSWRVWLLYLLVSAFTLFHILIRPRPTANLTPFVIVLGLFLFFGGISVAFWAYFRLKGPRQV